MKLVVEPAGDVAVVALLTDQLDASNADEFRRDMDPVLGDSLKVALDLSAVRFVDSRGCGAILSCLKALTGRGGDLRLFGVDPSVRTVFDLIRLPRICPVHTTRDEAVAAFAG